MKFLSDAERLAYFAGYGEVYNQPSEFSPAVFRGGPADGWRDEFRTPLASVDRGNRTTTVRHIYRHSGVMDGKQKVYAYEGTLSPPGMKNDAEWDAFYGEHAEYMRRVVGRERGESYSP